MRDQSEVVAPRFLRIENFLSEEERLAMLSFVAEHAERYEASAVKPLEESRGDRAHDDDVRRSSVVFDVEELWPIFEDRLNALLPVARQELDVDWFPVAEVEHQLTSHGDGDFFGVHSDTGGCRTDPRRVTYVYYFNLEPRQFEGGELRLYDAVERDGVIQPAASWSTIEPTDNTLVLFPSNAFHEVLPVTSTGEGPGATRHTMNGWFRTTDEFLAGVAVGQGLEVDREKMIELQRRYLPRFTEIGFEVRSTPPEIQQVLKALYDLRRHEAVPEGHDPTFMPTGDPELVYVDDIKHDIHERMRPLHEDWSGEKLEPTAAYGLRVYRGGQSLKLHIDRSATHVISSIVHIDHDQDEPWPLTIIDHAGVPRDISLEPGQMLFYESAVCPHGRPTPFAGRTYCSIFLHYKPVDGWDYTHEDLLAWGVEDGIL